MEYITRKGKEKYMMNKLKGNCDLVKALMDNKREHIIQNSISGGIDINIGVNTRKKK